jgi:hypothetical protein
MFFWQEDSERRYIGLQDGTLFVIQKISEGLPKAWVSQREVGESSNGY